VPGMLVEVLVEICGHQVTLLFNVIQRYLTDGLQSMETFSNWRGSVVE